MGWSMMCFFFVYEFSSVLLYGTGLQIILLFPLLFLCSHFRVWGVVLIKEVMVETPRSKEALEKLCDFLSSEEKTTKGNGTLADLFLTAPQNTIRSVEVEVAFLVSPPAHRVPLYFTAPHEVLPGTLCIITNPPQRKWKDKVQQLSEDGDVVAQRVKKVVDTKKLSMKFVDPVAVRALANSFDHFVLLGVKKYPHQLTGEFLGHQKLPVWVSRRGNFKDALRRAVNTIVVSRRGHSGVTCRIGHTGLSVDQLQENIQSFLAQLTSHAQATTLNDILRVRVAGTKSNGVRAGLPIFSHTFEIPRRVRESESGQKNSKRPRTGQ